MNGVSLTLNTVLRPLHNVDGKIVGVFGISRDVTERARALPTPKAFFESYPSEAMRATMREAHSAAASDGTVPLQGESGSGKELFGALDPRPFEACARSLFFAELRCHIKGIGGIRAVWT